MAYWNEGHVFALTTTILGEETGLRAINALMIDPALLDEAGDNVSRAAFAMAMNVILFDGLIDRVPSGAAYVRDLLAQGNRVTFDHGALRTMQFPNGPTGALPGGEAAFTRILQPLGYDMAAVYPLDRLRMTGRAYVHADWPEAIPQFFLSELHVDQFDAEFAEAAMRVFATSRDPLGDEAKAVLARFGAGDPVTLGAAGKALPDIVAAFERQHDLPAFADYQLLLSRSAEAAWMATEGNAFNHATDRVTDVGTLAQRLKANGYPMKDRVEISASGRVRQTAFRADGIERLFADGQWRTVPGSFYEFISRDIDPDSGRLDLAFDTGNATGIFAMTRVDTGESAGR